MWWVCVPMVCLLHVAAPQVDVDAAMERLEAALEVEVEEWVEEKAPATLAGAP